MKLVTWNANSIRQRLPRARALLARHEPDVLCLQETKVDEGAFPDLTDVGYHSAAFGQPRGRNGVAIVSRAEPRDVRLSFPGDPVPEQARAISATIGDLRVVNVYVINGKFVGAPEYELKLRWLDALISWITTEHDPRDPLVVMGDFNVAPADEDVHDPDAWRGQNLASEAERERVRALLEWGMVDLLRLHHAGVGPFTWWDYRAGAFHRGWGLRIDLALATAPVASRCHDVMVERDERKPTFGEGAPSDHAPVIVTVDASVR